MKILKDQGKASFAPVRLARLSYSAGWWIGPEGLVVSTAIVVTSEAEETGNPKNEQCRRERQKAGIPGWFGPKPGVRRIAEKLRRIKRRDIGTESVVFVLPRGPVGVYEKCTEPKENQKR